MSQLFQDIKQSFKRTDLKPVTEESLNQYTGLKNTYKEIKDYLTKNGLSIDNVYEATSGLYTFWYIENTVFIPIFNIDIESLKMLQLPQRVEAHKETLEKYWNNKDYESFFAFIEKQFTFEVFFNLLD